MSGLDELKPGEFPPIRDEAGYVPGVDSAVESTVRTDVDPKWFQSPKEPLRGPQESEEVERMKRLTDQVNHLGRQAISDL